MLVRLFVRLRRVFFLFFGGPERPTFRWGAGSLEVSLDPGDHLRVFARDIIGFGAEIHVATEQNEVIYRALDIDGKEVVEERDDDGGTRHRAAYRLSRTHPECMIIVVSQDGSVRYVGNQNGRVAYWDVLSF